MKLPAPNTRRSPVLLVAIVGGSGAGKTRLAARLQSALGDNAARLCQDDFYRDRSRVPASRRDRLNFDHPRAIDWKKLEETLQDCANGRAARVPCYDFRTHCRLAREQTLEPRRVVIADGLWLLRRPSLRRQFALRVFIECPARRRLQRRLRRDARARGRTPFSIRKQFETTVEPMHARYVAPQKRWADVVLPHDFGSADIRRLVTQLRNFTEL